MAQLESQFKKRVKADLDQLPECYYFVKEALALRGIADIIGCVNGCFFALELKRDKKQAEKKIGRIMLQRHYLKKVKQSGGYGVITFPDIWTYTLQELKGLRL